MVANTCSFASCDAASNEFAAEILYGERLVVRSGNPDALRDQNFGTRKMRFGCLVASGQHRFHQIAQLLRAELISFDVSRQLSAPVDDEGVK